MIVFVITHHFSLAIQESERCSEDLRRGSSLMFLFINLQWNNIIIWTFDSLNHIFITLLFHFFRWLIYPFPYTCKTKCKRCHQSGRGWVKQGYYQTGLHWKCIQVGNTKCSLIKIEENKEIWSISQLNLSFQALYNNSIISICHRNCIYILWLYTYHSFNLLYLTVYWRLYRPKRE